MSRTMFMHTLDGSPARFDPLFQIIHRVPNAGPWKATLAKSVEAIQRERALSKAAMKREGKVPGRYGYVVVEVPR